jgi:hypothetical protein
MHRAKTFIVLGFVAFAACGPSRSNPGRPTSASKAKLAALLK